MNTRRATRLHLSEVLARTPAKDASARRPDAGERRGAAGKILSRGAPQEPSELFGAFYGKDPDAAPLLEYYGLSRPAQ